MHVYYKMLLLRYTAQLKHFRQPPVTRDNGVPFLAGSRPFQIRGFPSAINSSRPIKSTVSRLFTSRDQATFLKQPIKRLQKLTLPLPGYDRWPSGYSDGVACKRMQVRIPKFSQIFTFQTFLFDGKYL